MMVPPLSLSSSCFNVIQLRAEHLGAFQGQEEEVGEVVSKMLRRSLIWLYIHRVAIKAPRQTNPSQLLF